MYRGFTLKLDNWNNDNYRKSGLELRESNREYVHQNLTRFIHANNVLDGSKIQNNWFPQINADIFISHSHKDEDKAILLSGWLFDRLKLKAFIDSEIWGYSNDLLRLLDNEYCMNEENPHYYDYDKRNLSTSHIHMMVATAISSMIEKTECLFFLNTPNAIKFFNEDKKITTESPWIYYELAMSKLLQGKSPSDHRGYAFEQKSIPITYSLNIKHLVELNQDELVKWQAAYNGKDNALDRLYQLYPHT